VEERKMWRNYDVKTDESDKIVMSKKQKIWNEKFWKELNRLISLHYLTVVYQMHCLSTVNYVP
jgi:hypothetical protein